MKPNFKIFRTLALAVALIAAGQTAVAGPYTTSYMEFAGFSRGGENGKHVIRCQGFIFWSSGQQNGNTHVFDGLTEYKDSDRRGKFTVTGTINLAENDGYTDVTTGSKVIIRFESSKYFFSDASVTKLDGTEVEDVTVAGGGDYRNWVQVTIPAGKTFGKINLIIDTHYPFDKGTTTISGIDEVYINDHVNRPEPIVTHYDPGSSPVLLTKDVDYKVSYTKNDKPGTATVTVTGMGDYLGSLSQNFTIRDLSLKDDFTKLGTNIYAISSQKDLDNLAFIVNEGNDCSGITLLQTADITYTDNGKGLPIGMDGKPFRGFYNGQDHIISGLVVDNNGTFEHESEKPPYYKYHLFSGLFGKLDGATVRNVRLLSPVIKNTPNVGQYMAGFVGMYYVPVWEVWPEVKLWYHSAGIAACIQNGSAVGSCFVYQPSFVFEKDDNSSQYDVFQQASAPIVYSSTESTQIASAQVYKATAGSNVSFAKNTIDSGDGFIYNSKRYYRADAGIAVTYNGPAPGDGNYVAFTDGDGNLLNAGGSGSTYTVLMPDRDVTIQASVASLSQVNLTAHPATLFGQTGCWATFYHGSCRYTLPEGATAYTMGSDHQLYRLGTDGRTIPAGVAVVILADQTSLTLQKTDDTSPVAIHGGGNILRGSDSPATVSGTPYMLGIVDYRLGFYEYSGGLVPAHKAYYVQ